MLFLCYSNNFHVKQNNKNFHYFTLLTPITIKPISNSKYHILTKYFRQIESMTITHLK